jgi:hypothetical protein
MDRAVGRVGIGVIWRGNSVGLAHRMRNSYKAFSSVLAGGGLAIFYVPSRWHSTSFSYSASWLRF